MQSLLEKKMNGKHTLFCVLLIGATFAWVCEDGVPYSENNCNECFCDNRMLACTEMGCLSEENRKLRNCEVGTTSRKDCNDCECVEKIGTVCTNHKC